MKSVMIMWDQENLLLRLSLLSVSEPGLSATQFQPSSPGSGPPEGAEPPGVVWGGASSRGGASRSWFGEGLPKGAGLQGLVWGKAFRGVVLQ